MAHLIDLLAVRLAGFSVFLQSEGAYGAVHSCEMFGSGAVFAALTAKRTNGGNRVFAAAASQFR